MRYTGTNQYRRRKHPIFTGRILAKWYFALVLVFLTMALYQKAQHVPQAHAYYISPLAKSAGIHLKKESTPAVMPAETLTPTPYQYDAVSVIKRVWGKDAYVGIAIASCESGINANKYHINNDGSIDFSVFQVNTVHGTILDPEENIRYAYSLFLRQGTTPWLSSKSCWKWKL